MRRHLPLGALLLVFAVLSGGLTVLFRLRLAQGDVDIFTRVLAGIFDTAKTGFDISLGLVGVMSLWWMAALAAIAFVEQVVPGGDRLRIPGDGDEVGCEDQHDGGLYQPSQSRQAHFVAGELQGGGARRMCSWR